MLVPSTAVYLKVAFEAEYHRGRPLSDTLPLTKRIRDALPAVLTIWGSSPSDKLPNHMRQIDLFDERAYTGLLDRKYSMETPAVRSTRHTRGL